LAEAILGALNSGWVGFAAAYRLCPLQSRQTPIGWKGRGLALFELP
jgi:hypothetical protein